MTQKPKKPCNHPGCKQLVEGGGYCSKHKRQKQREQDRERGTAAQRGYNHLWRDYRRQFLAQHPWCIRCLQQGRFVPATVVDHIIPHRGDHSLFWDNNNHQALCKRCHDVKTATVDGGFGNTPRV